MFELHETGVAGALFLDGRLAGFWLMISPAGGEHARPLWLRWDGCFHAIVVVGCLSERVGWHCIQWADQHEVGFGSLDILV